MDTPDATAADLSHVVIRMATLDDHDAIHRLYQTGRDEGMVYANDTGADIDNLAAGYLADGAESGFWVAEVDGTIVGMIGLLKTGENAAELRRLRVDPDHRRRGIGRRLLEQALLFCQQRDYLKVVLDVRIDGEPAIRLFETFGFKHSRTRDLGGRTLLEFYLDLYKEADNDRG